MAAARTNCLVPAVDLHERTVLLVQWMLLFGILPFDRRHRIGEHAAHRVVERAPLGFGKRGHAPQRTDSRGEEYLIGVRVADAGYEYLVAQHVLDLAAMPLQPGEKSFERERWIQRVRTEIGERGDVLH